MSRPLDTWRLCGRPFDEHADDRGCTCTPNDPTRRRAADAHERLSEVEVREDA